LCAWHPLLHVGLAQTYCKAMFVEGCEGKVVGGVPPVTAPAPLGQEDRVHTVDLVAWAYVPTHVFPATRLAMLYHLEGSQVASSYEKVNMALPSARQKDLSRSPPVLLATQSPMDTSL